MLRREQFVRLCCGGALALALLREAGSVFVARMLTVVTSLRSQNRNVLEFMTEAVRASREDTFRASREDTLPPSLLPQYSQSHPSDSIGLSAPNTDKLSEVVLPLG